MPTQIRFDESAHSALEVGVSKLADAVEHFADATVVSYVPILAYRAARETAKKSREVVEQGDEQ